MKTIKENFFKKFSMSITGLTLSRVPKKYILLLILFLVGVLYFRYFPVIYDFDGTVFSQHLRYAVLKENMKPVIQEHHLLYLPCNYHLYRSLNALTGYRPLEYFHLQVFSLLFGLMTLWVLYKILSRIIRKNTYFFSIGGVLLIAFSYGFWYYSVEAEMDMPGLFFIVTGVYFLWFKDRNRRNTLLAALMLSMAAGFHLTNGLIVASLMLLTLHYLIRERKTFLTSVFGGFYIYYCVFLAIPYIIYYLVSGVNILESFRNFLLGSGVDPYSGYKISYWEAISFPTFWKFIKTAAHSILSPSNQVLPVVSLLLLFAMIVAVAAGFIRSVSMGKGRAAEERAVGDRGVYYKLLVWMVPYMLFFGFWSTGNIGFKLNIVLPLLILFIYSLSLLKWERVTRVTFVLLVLGMFGCNFFYVVLPANDPANNEGYRLVEEIGTKTGNDAAIIIAGCGEQTSIYSKIYIPYFAHRKVFVLDWMLGRGSSLDDIVLTLKKEGKERTLYFLSEVTSGSKAVEQLLKNHKLGADDFSGFLGQLRTKKTIPLIPGFYLYEIDHTN
ncbi:MAG: hypothetical protein GY757_22085 [bacterium]|nr:hypothetical protein [bacterium]